MKVIFIGIDGVLNTDSKPCYYGCSLIDQDLVAILKSVVSRTKSEIVLSSTWRLCKENRQTVKIALKKKNLKFIDYTPQLPPKRHQFWINRADEIKAWLKEHPQVKKFAILDENFDAGVGFKENFFQTDSTFGLTEEMAAKIVEHLNA